MRKIVLPLLGISTLVFASINGTNLDHPISNNAVNKLSLSFAKKLLTSNHLAKINNNKTQAPNNMSIIKDNKWQPADYIATIKNNKLPYTKISYTSLPEIKKLLLQYSDTLRPEVADTVLTLIQCAKKRDVPFNNILTIIDYSLPSNKKRMWIFDMREKILLFHTYVSHGINSGTLDSTHFSNKFNSKASSLGLYTTEQSYYGRHGLALRLYGRDISFNHNATRRAIVMHSAWYVNENFINKYGRVGRSWGCPAVPKNMIKPIVKALKDPSIYVIYYPSYRWYASSIYLRCKTASSMNVAKMLTQVPKDVLPDNRNEVMYIDKNNNKSHQEHEPVLVMSADDYKRIINPKVPLTRMLRRQFNNTEYVALNSNEIQSMDTNHDTVINENDNHSLDSIDFVIPVVKTYRGRYLSTVFKSVKSSPIKAINLNSSQVNDDIQFNNLTIQYTSKATNHLRTTDRFIRWLGL